MKQPSYFSWIFNWATILSPLYRVFVVMLLCDRALLIISPPGIVFCRSHECSWKWLREFRITEDSSWGDCCFARTLKKTYNIRKNSDVSSPKMPQAATLHNNNDASLNNQRRCFFPWNNHRSREDRCDTIGVTLENNIFLNWLQRDIKLTILLYLFFVNALDKILCCSDL